MFTTELNHQTLRSWAAASPRPDAEHLADLQLRKHPPPDRRRARPRGVVAAGLARAAHRLDRDAARRAIA
ncbi:MAG TPA: hypothetical protein VIL49_15065 [Capillimicrobium sp.]